MKSQQNIITRGSTNERWFLGEFQSKSADLDINNFPVLIYRTEGGVPDVTFEEDTVWLMQEQMASLFSRGFLLRSLWRDVSRSTLAEAKVAKNYLNEKELRAMRQGDVRRGG